MKIAYLILAHSDPIHLGRLVDALDSGCNKFFIHIDGKVAVAPFRQAVAHSKNCLFTKKRVVVKWGGFGMVAATLSLIREAVAQTPQSDYFVLLSGSDYPIKSNEQINEFFERHPGRPYLKYTRIADCPFLQDRIRRYHFPDMPWRPRVFLENAFGRLLPKRRFIKGLDPYFGSQWWALTPDCIEHVLRFVDNSPSFVRYFRYSGIPDETFFHTIVLNNAELREKTDTRVEFVKWPKLKDPVPEAGEHIKYIDWSLDREKPAILGEWDFEALSETPMLFARKMSTERSSGLIHKINIELLGLK